MLEDIRRYALGREQNDDNIVMPISELVEQMVPSIIWETGNIAQIQSLLVLRQAELILAEKQVTGEANHDWYANNRIKDLTIKIADLKRWITEAERKEGN